MDKKKEGWMERWRGKWMDDGMGLTGTQYRLVVAWPQKQNFS